LPDRGFQHGEVDVFQGFELDAISGDARLAEFFSIGLGQVFLVFDAEDIDGNSGGIGAQADLIKLPRLSIGIFDRPQSVSDIGIGNDFAFAVPAVQEPQFAARHGAQDRAVQHLHVAAFGFRLSSNVSLDLCFTVMCRSLWDWRDGNRNAPFPNYNPKSNCTSAEN